jgi:hypothetical protein
MKESLFIFAVGATLYGALAECAYGTVPDPAQHEETAGEAPHLGVVILSDETGAGASPDNEQVDLTADFETLRARVSEEGFSAVEESLLSVLADANGRLRIEAAKETVHLYMAHGLYAEVLSLIEEHDPDFADPFLTLSRGIAAYKLARYDDAADALKKSSAQSLEASAAWRGMANAQRGSFVAAAADLFNAKPPQAHPGGDSAGFYLLKAETAMVRGELESVRAALDELRRVPINDSHRARRALLESELMMRQNRKDVARETLKRVEAVSPQPYAQLASLALLKDAVSSQLLSPQVAAERVDALMMSWRGGVFEREALAFRAWVYSRAGDLGEAFISRRKILTEYAEADISKPAEQAMRRDLATLFTEHDMAPLAAAKIFYENIDMAPPGAEGDALIRNIADDLASLDLVDEAVELLEHQTFKRLRGKERSRTAAVLASLYLKSGKPQETLRVIRSTRMARLSDALNTERRLLEARALIETESAEEALLLLERDASAAASMLRGEIYWQEKKWAPAGDEFRAAAGLEEQENNLTREESVAVLRAASAYALAGAEAKLVSLGKDADGRLSSEDANKVLRGLAFEGHDFNSEEFRNAYSAFFGASASAS